MLTSNTKRRLAFGLAAAAIGATLVGGSAAGPASADPTQLTALVGMGSDTTQDVMNALSGFNNGINYTAINSGAATNYRHIISFDASPAQSAGDNCVTPVINGPTFTRPNGSGAGRKALFAGSGLSAAGWTGSTFTLDNGTVLPTCATTVNIAGAVNFARSSSVSGTAGTDVTYIPFGRDAVTFASYRPGGGTPVSTLTRLQLIQAYDNATLLTIPDPDGSGTLTVVPCGIQTSSGTMQFFRDTVTQSNVANEAAAVNTCTPTAASRLQESKGDLLKIKGDALDATMDDFVVITGYSAAAYIAQANLVSNPNGFNQIQIGSISDDTTTGTGGPSNNIGSPIQGVAPALTPNPTFYASTAVGRNVYNVIRRSLIVNGAGTLLNNAFTALFATPTSKVCSATATINTFGFASIANCGEYNVTNRAWDTGVS